VHTCKSSALLDVFSQRVLDFYEVDSSLAPSDRPLLLTFIDRKTRRALIGQDEYLAKLRERFPDVLVQVVDLASLSLPEQLALVRNTDILAGVRGAGLTHGIFMAAGSAMVEIILYDFGQRLSESCKVEGPSVFWDPFDGERRS
jgi:EGF domain-specific O-GlcNAc transferase